MLPQLATAVALVFGFPVLTVYLGLLERKVLAGMQTRLGPMRVGPHGLFQGIADALKLVLKEDIVPAGAEPLLFRVAPLMAAAAALTALGVIPFSRAIYVADVNAGLLIVVATASFGVLGLVLGGWASNSHYPLLGAFRSAAQLISYEIALGFALLTALLSAGTLRLSGIVEAQRERHIWFAFNNWGCMLPAFAIYFVASLAESNRAPFDLPEAESELAGGYHLEYSGFRWALFMLAEYANLFVACAVGVILFWGGWLPPFPNVPWLAKVFGSALPAVVFLTGAGGAAFLFRESRMLLHRLALAGIGCAMLGLAGLFFVPQFAAEASGVFWFAFKILALLYVAMWFRATFPRLRYDQLMRLGWKVLIPAGMACVAINAIFGLLR